MKERIFQFGPKRGLFGIFTEPAKTDLGPDAPAVIMLNAGLLHRIGPHRMSVQLARSLADAGIRSLRFDMSGFGDSAVMTNGKSEDDHVFSDVKHAMDFLEEKQIARSFVLFGLCSGADNSYAVALLDSRVVGAVFLDGHGFWTFRSRAVHYLPRMLRPRSWFNYARRSRPQSALSIGQDSLLGQRKLRRPFGEQVEVERALQSLVDRGTQMLYFYTGSVEYYYNYAGQFFDMFKGLKPRGRIKVVYYPSADHTYTFAEDRDRMFSTLIDWYLSRPWAGSQQEIKTKVSTVSQS
jgi:pimeloyl-ACP methyl ester carboxylesterase